MTHCETYNILTEVQHRFRRERSCESQLLETTDDLAYHLDQGNQVDVIVLDFRKAFDTVLHRRLLSKLDHLGIRGSIYGWIQAFLTDRKQKVVVDGAESTSESVLSGVPQGTVMGPLLFLLYINDLPQSIKSQVRLFADDALIYHVIHNQSDHETLQADLQHLETWQRNWLMQFNPSNDPSAQYFIWPVPDANQSLRLLFMWPTIQPSGFKPISWRRDFTHIVMEPSHRQYCKESQLRHGSGEAKPLCSTQRNKDPGIPIHS